MTVEALKNTSAMMSEGDDDMEIDEKDVLVLGSGGFGHVYDVSEEISFIENFEQM